MIREALLRSVGVVRVHPWVMLALGSALVLALASTFTGLGLLLAPWFVCELFALSLGASGVPMRARGLAWAQAAGILLATGVLFGSVVALAALVFGPDLALVDRTSVMPWDQALLRLAAIVAISLVSLAYVLPFVHLPGILIERGGPFGTAVLESLLLVRRVGALATFRLVLVAAGFALFPAILAAMVAARILDRASTPLGLLASAPFLLVSLPVGLGVAAQGYLLARHLLPPRHLVHGVGLPRYTLALLSVGVLAPVLGLVLLLAACALPAPLLRGAPRDATLLLEQGLGEHVVPGTTLRFSASVDRVEVRPSMDDAVAVLRVPRGARGRPAVESVATHSVHDVLAVELRGEGGAPLGHALFTGAGVRIDDTVHRALDERMGAGRALLFGPSFLVIALLVLAALGPLAEARIEGSAQQALTDARTRARRVAWLLVPVWGLIVTLGALALLGL
jgi:hypothetical protein